MSESRGSVRPVVGASDVGEELTRAVARWARGQEASRMDRDKMLEVTLTQIEKQYGKGAVMKLGEHPMGAGIGVIPTGSLALDIALGVGGIPRGRIVEVFGPEGSGKTTVCLHIIAEAQRHGGIAAFIDAEHALDPTYAQRLGLNIDELLVSQPDSGEQALEIADMLVRSGALDVVVIDSVAALVPRGKIVNQRMPVEVLSYDPEAGAIVPRKVVNWFDNGRTEGFLQFTVAKPGGNGRAQFGCTPNHQIRTRGGWREARELSVGDRVLQSVPVRLSNFQWQVILGGLMGDSAISPSKSGLAGRYRFGHGVRQTEYADWKASLLANIGTSRTTNAKGAVFHDLPALVELAELREAVYIAGKKVFSEDYLKQLTPLSLATWYMDDGTFAIRAKGLQARTRDGSGRAEICVEAMDPTTQSRLMDHLTDTWGIVPKLIQRGGKAVLQFPKDETAKLHALIAPFVHPSMQYKLLPRFRGRFEVEPVFVPMRRELAPMPIVSIAPKPPSRSTHRFDIEVEGSHNYLVDGVVVHNSPETTPGGRALKFYSSIRLDVRKIENLKDGTDVVGSRTRVKVVKNKVAPPFRQCEFDIMYGTGISKEGSLLDVGVDLEIVKKSGAWFTYEGEQLGQGRENSRQFLVEHQDVAQDIERKVREGVGLTAFGEEGDETPIEVVPDLVVTDEPAPSKARERETTGAPAG